MKRKRENWEPLRSRSIYPGIAPLHHGLQRAKALLPTRYRWPCREHVPSAVSAGPQLKRRRRASTMKPHTTVPVSNSVFQKPYIDIQTSEKYSIPRYHETKPSSNYPHLHLITGTCNFKIESPSSLSLSPLLLARPWIFNCSTWPCLKACRLSSTHDKSQFLISGAELTRWDESSLLSLSRESRLKRNERKENGGGGGRGVTISPTRGTKIVNLKKTQ